MATTASVPKGTYAGGSHVATHTVSEDSVTKHIQRVSLSDPDGKDVTASTTGGVPAAVSVTDATNGVQVLATGATRVGWVVHNQSAADVYVGFSATGLTTANGIRIFPGGSWGQQGPGVYRGVIHAIVATVDSPAEVRVQAWG